MWGDDDQRWSEARIIFHDTEPSNWTWDPQRQQYYWHRFFHHQPDLNYDNPEVAGGDDRRRPLLARHRPRRLPARRRPLPLRARRHQRREPARDPRATCGGCAARSTPRTRARCCWPRPTSGRATSCSTSATATSATCASTSRSCPACTWRPSAATGGRSSRSWPRRPRIPDGCQWGLFLRNHDELTLEMVSDTERDELYAEYAQRPEDAPQHRHRPPARAAARQPAPADGAVPRPAVLDAGQPGPVLRRRDRHGREHPPRRPRRRAHADAVDARPQRRLLHGRLRAAVPAADHGPGLRLPGRERRVASGATRARSCSGCGG